MSIHMVYHQMKVLSQFLCHMQSSKRTKKKWDSVAICMQFGNRCEIETCQMCKQRAAIVFHLVWIANQVISKHNPKGLP